MVRTTQTMVYNLIDEINLLLPNTIDLKGVFTKSNKTSIWKFIIKGDSYPIEFSTKESYQFFLGLKTGIKFFYTKT